MPGGLLLVENQLLIITEVKKRGNHRRIDVKRRVTVSQDGLRPQGQAPKGQTHALPHFTSLLIECSAMSTENVDGTSSLAVPPALSTLRPLTVDKILDSSWSVFQNLEPFLEA
ncbi:hypothetical protein FRC17_009069, partial [Serendipita sp. 399]